MSIDVVMLWKQVRKPMQLYGSHRWLLKGLSALSRTDILIMELLGRDGLLGEILHCLYFGGNSLQRKVFRVGYFSWFFMVA